MRLQTIRSGDGRLEDLRFDALGLDALLALGVRVGTGNRWHAVFAVAADWFVTVAPDSDIEIRLDPDPIDEERECVIRHAVAATMPGAEINVGLYLRGYSGEHSLISEVFLEL